MKQTPDREYLIAARHNELQAHDGGQAKRLDALVAKSLLTSAAGLYHITPAGRDLVKDIPA